MSIVKFALIRYDDRDTTKIYTHVVSITEIKKSVTISGKKEFVSMNPIRKIDFLPSQWYYVFKRLCVSDCIVNHCHGQHRKIKILHLGGKYLFL